MGHLPNNAQLIKWRTGDPLFAADLDHNFALLHGWVETTAALAKSPDAATQAAIDALAQLARRVAALEQREAGSERRKNERVYTPLAAHGDLVRQMNALAGPLRHAAATLRAECGSLSAKQGPMEARLAALEQAPEPPRMDVFKAMEAEVVRAQAQVRIAVGQAIAVRNEMAALRKLVACA